MCLSIKPLEAACGASVTGLNLSLPLSGRTLAKLKAAWHDHHLLIFPDQIISESDLERVSLSFGPFGENPYIASIADYKNIIPIRRHARETGPVFAASWHTDWSFLAHPPLGTSLYAKIIPNKGGDTIFSNQHLALECMPPGLRTRLKDKRALHSGRDTYAPGGTYSKMDKALSGMQITPSSKARATQAHPLIMAHPVTGRLAIYGTAGHIVGLEGMSEAESRPLLEELHHWQTQEAFQYRHTWHPNMLVLWDNRALIHMATGGYEGHDRLLYRTTISLAPPA